MKKNFFTNKPSQTKKLGEILAQKIKKGWRVGRSLKTKTKKAALVIGLEGDLGGGKTTFLQGFAKGLRIKQKILSPTFVIIKRFQLNNLTIKQFNNFFHVDCYRIQKPKEVLDLGFKEIISKPQNIITIEWADKIRKILPKNTIWLKFVFVDERTRKIVLTTPNSKNHSVNPVRSLGQKKLFKFFLQ